MYCTFRSSDTVWGYQAWIIRYTSGTLNYNQCTVCVIFVFLFNLKVPLDWSQLFWQKLVWCHEEVPWGYFMQWTANIFHAKVAHKSFGSEKRKGMFLSAFTFMLLNVQTMCNYVRLSGLNHILVEVCINQSINQSIWNHALLPLCIYMSHHTIIILAKLL